jgi:hypothetical protein
VSNNVRERHRLALRPFVSSVGLHAVTHQEKRQRDACCRRQEQTVVQSPVSGEDRVEYDASKHGDERDHQADAKPPSVDLAEDRLIVGSTCA